MRYEDAVALLDTAPGVDQRVAETVLAELGADMRRFPTPEHAAAWSGLAPGNNESGGKRYSGRTRQGNQALCSSLVQAAWSAVRTQDTYLGARYERLVVRRGKKRAIVAVAHLLLKSIWHMLAYHEPYQDLGGDYFDNRRKESKINYYLSQVAQPGLRNPDRASAASAVRLFSEELRLRYNIPTLDMFAAQMWRLRCLTDPRDPG